MKQKLTQKQKQKLFRMLSYAAMTVSVIVISLICMLLILGYRFDSQNGTIEQGGLMQFRSFPDNASVTLDNKVLSFRTPGRMNVATGQHTTAFSLDGYQTWQKTSNVKAGELKWLNYARMVPSSVTTTPVASHEVVSDTLPSPDRRWFALIADPAAPTITIYDIREPQSPKASTLTLPADQLTVQEGVTQTYSLEEWDFGGRYMIVRHQSGETVEYLRIDRTQPSQVVNISVVLNIEINDIHFSGTNGNIYFARTGSDLRRLDIGAGSISQPLVSQIDHFELYRNDVIAYTATHADKRIVGVFIDNKDTIVRTYALETPLSIDISNYFDNEYLVIATSKSVQIIRDPLENADSAGRTFANIAFDQDVAWVEFSSSGRFAVAGNGNRFTTYDIETDEQFNADLPGDQSVASRPLSWLDDYYLYDDVTGTLKIGEFDGTNQHDISSDAPGFSATLSEDGEYLFSIGKSQSGFVLQSSRMVTQPQ